MRQIENHYDKNVYNGDIGHVEAVDPKAGELSVGFEGRSVTYGFGELDALVPVYAATVHKSQGSEYPVVAIPVLTQHYAMLLRNLLYAGVTRGKRLVVLVGQKKAVAISACNLSGRRRWSKLDEWLVGGHDDGAGLETTSDRRAGSIPWHSPLVKQLAPCRRSYLAASSYGTCTFVGSGDMKKAELAAPVADKVHLTNRQAEAIINIFFTCITQALREGDKVELRGFGSFRARSRDARQGRNPRTGEVVQVPSRKAPFFRAGKEFQERVRRSQVLLRIFHQDPTRT